MSISLSQINIYPIKSCKGISLTACEIEPRGFRLDRRWMLVDDRGAQITQREFPRLTFVSVSEEESHLRVGAPGMGELIVPFAVYNPEMRSVTVFDDEVRAAIVGDDAARWFSEYLGITCTLVTMTDRSTRFVDRTYAVNNDVTSFADAFPFMLLSEESLADLNSRLRVPLPMKRFRPNLVVKGSEPYAEDTWSEIRIGDVGFHLVKPCARCAIPTVDTETGMKGVEPLQTLATYRTVNNKVMFGQNAISAVLGTLHVGDQIQIIS
ncbi:MAG: MOSC domain-containing protein, partial [Ignavibacteriae bacterium]|nr:MOSC domain-containing protein [Ignavibacteriota bacterium]